MKYTPEQLQPIIEPILENILKFAENKFAEGFDLKTISDLVMEKTFAEFGKIEPDALRQAYTTLSTNEICGALLRQRKEKKLRAAVEKFKNEIAKSEIEDE